MYSYLKPIIKTISNLVSEQSAFSVALLLGLEPVGVALGAGEDEGRALVLLRVVVPVRDPLLTGAWNPQNETVLDTFKVMLATVLL